MRDLTAIVLTFNERENIARALAALTWVERVLVVDSFSTDETCELARRYSNVEIVQRAFDTHTAQWNFALGQANTDWVLTLDADYEVSTALAGEIAAVEPGPNVAGFMARFEFRIFGHTLHASVYPPRAVLFRRSRACYRQDGHTQLLHTDGPVQMLQGVIYHDDRKPLSRWIGSQDQYVKLEAAHLLSTSDQALSKQDRVRKRIYFAAPVMFLYLLLGRGLLFGGWPAWYYVAQRTLAELLLSLRLLTERHRLEETRSS